MTIGIDGFLDWAERKDGIANKVYSQPNKGDGIACHSQEGYRNSIESRFFATDRNPDGSYTSYAAASTMFYNPLTGPLVQYYPVTASTWTSGNWIANTTLWAVESEGLAGTPLNANQVANMVRLGHEWEARTGKRLVRRETLWQHNEVWNWATPNAGPTACPSNRYAPFFEAWAAKEDEMTEDQIKALIDKAIAAQFPALLAAAFAPNDERGFGEKDAQRLIAEAKAGIIAGLSGGLTSGITFTAKVQ